MRVVLFLTLSLFLSFCGRIENNKIDPSSGKDILEMTEHIKIDGLKDELIGVFSGNDVYEFIGISSNGVDCLYFPYKNGKFNIEFEILSAEQKPYGEKLKAFAKSKGLKVIMTSYRRKEYYKTEDAKNVIHIEANTDINTISLLAKEIETKVFGNDKEVVYDVVPQ